MKNQHITAMAAMALGLSTAFVSGASAETKTLYIGMNGHV